jgi:hypothetical protein
LPKNGQGHGEGAKEYRKKVLGVKTQHHAQAQKGYHAEREVSLKRDERNKQFYYNHGNIR